VERISLLSTNKEAAIKRCDTHISGRTDLPEHAVLNCLLSLEQLVLSLNIWDTNKFSTVGIGLTQDSKTDLIKHLIASYLLTGNIYVYQV
jgi:hypothetical protein